MLPSGLDENVSDDEHLARFLTQSSHFTTTIPKPSAFLPSPKNRETSVSRHGSEPRDALWEIGLAAAGPRRLYGAALFKARAARAVQLEVLADEPPPRHAVLRGWPWDETDPELQKARQKEISTVIASQAVLLLR